MSRFNVGLDLFPLLAASLSAVGCGVLGNFLVLRKLSLMGDAISHSVLPGLVIAFLVASSRNPLVMFAGAAVAGVATVVLVELVKKLGRVEPGAAMGVVFSVLFALGVLLIERASVRHVDLDADCVLHGQLETLVWYGAPDSLAGVFSWATLHAVPRQVVTLAAMALLAIGFTVMLFKELRLAAFDPDMASSQGVNATLMHYLLMVFVAAATVASFEAVGSILVVAMLICPAASARLLTDRLWAQIVCSIVIALACGIAGYIAATAVPAAFGMDAVNAAGSMAMTAGGVLALAIVAGPRHGLIARMIRRRRLSDLIARDDLLTLLFRAAEAGEHSVTINRVRSSLEGRRAATAISRAARSGLITRTGGRIGLTDAGAGEAALIVRRHRLWEQYLVDEAGLAPDHVHDVAEQLEHVPPSPPLGPSQDPHGRLIP